MSMNHYRAYQSILRSPDTEVSIFRLVIWEQASICYSLMSITWPFSRSFIKGFQTSPMVTVSHYGSGAVENSTANSNGRMDSARSILSKRPCQGRSMHSSTVYSQPIKPHRDHVGFGSQEMIIRRDDEVTVSYGASSGRGLLV
jgi:hypothetical protein